MTGLRQFILSSRRPPGLQILARSVHGVIPPCPWFPLLLYTLVSTVLMPPPAPRRQGPSAGRTQAARGPGGGDPRDPTAHSTRQHCVLYRAWGESVVRWPAPHTSGSLSTQLLVECQCVSRETTDETRHRPDSASSGSGSGADAEHRNERMRARRVISLRAEDYRHSMGGCEPMMVHGP